MIPKLTLDIEAIHENWKEHPESWPEIEKIYDLVKIGDGSIPAYPYHCAYIFIKLGVFKEFKNVADPSYDYGYCDSESALIKYLQKYIESEENFFIEVGLLDMEYENYYEFGTYIDENGVDTEDDYDWDNEHEQQYPGFWIRFNVVKLLKN